jgi:hypothetical protein
MAGHDGQSSAEEVGRGKVAGAAGYLGKAWRGAEGVTGRMAVHEGRLYSRSRAWHERGRGGESTARVARAAVASPRSAGQARHRARGTVRSGHFQALIGPRSSRNYPISLHKISSLSLTLCFSCSARVDLISGWRVTRMLSWVCRPAGTRDQSQAKSCQTILV